jgi:hypothetical protein
MPITREQGAAISIVEHQIQKLLVDLEEEAGVKVEHLDVDTRNFANLAVAIVVREML